VRAQHEPAQRQLPGQPLPERAGLADVFVEGAEGAAQLVLGHQLLGGGHLSRDGQRQLVDGAGWRRRPAALATEAQQPLPGVVIGKGRAVGKRQVLDSPESLHESLGLPDHRSGCGGVPQLLQPLGRCPAQIDPEEKPDRR